MVDSLPAIVQGIFDTNNSYTFLDGAAMFHPASLTYDDKSRGTMRLKRVSDL